MKKKGRKAALSPRPREPAARAAVVTYERVASPVTRLQILTASLDSSPSPFEARWTISAASAGLLETISFLRSRSDHRNARIPSLLPCRIPSWLADVIDGGCASPRDSRWGAVRIPLALLVSEAAG